MASLRPGTAPESSLSLRNLKRLALVKDPMPSIPEADKASQKSSTRVESASQKRPLGFGLQQRDASKPPTDTKQP